MNRFVSRSSQEILTRAYKKVQRGEPRTDPKGEKRRGRRTCEAGVIKGSYYAGCDTFGGTALTEHPKA